MALNNSQYDAVMRIFKQRQLKDQEELTERIEYICNKYPDYKELDDQIATLGSAIVRNRILGNSEKIAELTKEMDEISLKKKELLKSYGYADDYLMIHYECPICSDTGYVNNEKCICFRKIVADNLYSHANLDVILEDCNFENLSYEYYEGDDLKRFSNTVTACKNFVDKFEMDYENLLFYGTVGTGKSFLSACIAGELIKRGFPVLYFSATELFTLMSDIMFDKGDTNELRSMKSDLYSCDLLIIDDLGIEITNSAVASELFSLLNERHLKKKATIISTNLDLKELNERYADRIFSRILERYSIHKISGPDIRRIKKTQSNY